MQYFVGSDFPR